MPGIPTEHLADQIRETNQRLVESHERLADEIHELSRKFDDFRVEIAVKLGEINTTLENHQTSLRFAGRSIIILIPVVITLIGAAFGITWYAAKLDSRVERIESRLDKAPLLPAPKPGP